MAAHLARLLLGFVFFLIVLSSFSQSTSAAGCHNSPFGAVRAATGAVPATRQLLGRVDRARFDRRQLRQVDFSQRSGIPTENALDYGGSSNTANAFSSVPGDFRRIGALGFGSSVTPSRSFSAADTTVISGVGGDDNMAGGSGVGEGSGSETIGSNRGYSSAGGRKLMQ